MTDHRDLLGISHLLSGDNATAIPYRIYQKASHPFALIPNDYPSHRQLANFLPAQSKLARLFRRLLEAFPASARLFGKQMVIHYAKDKDFVRFLIQAGGSPIKGTQTAPLFLLGNPHGEAPRLILICRNVGGQPAVAVKAGLNPAAKSLIKTEGAFLKNPPECVRDSIPKHLRSYADVGVEAFAMECIFGRTPQPADLSKLPLLLRGWESDQAPRPLGEFPDWQRLRTALHGAEVPFPASLLELECTTMQPMVSHGDLAPWNVKITPQGPWKVFDWERGECVGIPGWDWFHYLVQSALLIDRLGSVELGKYFAAILHTEPYREYLGTLGIAGTAETLFYAYLLYNWHVLRPDDARDRPRKNASFALNKLQSTGS